MAFINGTGKFLSILKDNHANFGFYALGADE
jgi:hypothetical protein